MIASDLTLVDLMKRRSRTCPQLQELTGRSQSSIAHAITRLEGKKLIYQTASMALSPSGRWVATYRVATPARKRNPATRATRPSAY